jgi:hypothetical protein
VGPRGGLDTRSPLPGSNLDRPVVQPLARHSLYKYLLKYILRVRKVELSGFLCKFISFHCTVHHRGPLFNIIKVPYYQHPFVSKFFLHLYGNENF